MNSDGLFPRGPVTKLVTTMLTGIGLLVLFIAVGLGLSYVAKNYGRYQKRQDAENRVKVTAINIRNAQQQARVVTAEIAATKAEAQKRYQEAVGIRRAQDEIQATLTPLYVQHEAIQSQKEMADSPNHTIIWAPAGSNGVPFVTDPLKVGR